MFPSALECNGMCQNDGFISSVICTASPLISTDSTLVVFGIPCPSHTALIKRCGHSEMVCLGKKYLK